MQVGIRVFAAALISVLLLSACSVEDLNPFEIPDNLDINSILGIDCREDSECPEDAVCINNACRPFCSRLVDCPEELWCDYVSGSCVVEEALGPQYGAYIGNACRSIADCPEGSACVRLNGGMVCTVPCVSTLECLDLMPNSCCIKNDDAFYCAPSEICQTTDGDIDAIETESEPDDDPESEIPECQPDTYRCRDSYTIERCNIDKEWVIYRRCSDETICYSGECVTGSECDPGMYCCPGTYRCFMKDVQICNREGTRWDFYRSCSNTEICVDGTCYTPPGVDGDDNDPPDGDDDDNYCNVQDGCEDPGEYCLPATPEAEIGTCHLYCDAPGGYCPVGYECIHGVCEPVDGYCKDDRYCEMDEFCRRLPGAEVGKCAPYCFNLGENCPEHYICEQNPSSPNYGYCILDGDCRSCQFDGECDPGMFCRRMAGMATGCCEPSCRSDSDCPNGLCCLDGECSPNCSIVEPGNCNGGCPDCYICDPAWDACTPNISLCQGGYDCWEASSSTCCYNCGDCVNPLVCGILMYPCCPGYSCTAIVYGVIGYCI